MPAPIPPSPFPDGPLSLLWDALVLRLSTSPTLGKVKTAELWKGSAASVLPITLAELPAVRITPAAGSFKWADECRFDGPFILKVRFAVRGTRARDLFNFWHALAKALSPTNAFMNVLQPLGCYNLAMTAPAIEPRLICDGQAIEAEGYITLLVNVPI